MSGLSARSSLPVLVLGGGISGLACAYYLSKLPSSALRGRKVVAIEGQTATGGWLQSRNFDDGVVHELGPRSIRTAGVVGLNTLSLVEELGLASEVIGIPSSSPAAKKRLIYADGQLHALPASLYHICRTQKPFSKPLAACLIEELLKPRFKLDPAEDISVYEFMKQRLGSEAAEFLSDPLCRGITAGDSRKLSFKSMFPEVFQKSLARGSLVKGMLFEKRQPLPQGMLVSRESLSIPFEKEKWIAWSLKQGLQRFTDKLSQSLRDCEEVELLTANRISKIEFQEKKTTVTVTSESGVMKTLDASDVFCSLPAAALAACLSEEEKHLKTALEKINFVTVAVACLEFKGKDALKPDAGFGLLTPSFEDSRVLGITFDSCSFPQHDAGQDNTRVTCMMGGEWFSELFSNHTDDQILGEAEESARMILGFRSELLRSSFRVHRNCIPQYYLNHSNVVREIRDRLANQCGSFHLLGSSYDGVSVNDVIFNARKAVHEFAQKQHNSEQ